MKLLIIAVVGVIGMGFLFQDDIGRAFSKYGVQGGSYGASSGGSSSGARRLGNSSNRNFGGVGGALGR